METNHLPELTPTTTAKKPYEKPTFRHEQVFVTTALSCGKLATQGTCQHGQASAS
ncbi:MAG TPA: hypothetical protein VMG82_09450 [Candidatus Sulfotelmatobacter sp.]|nr:hypothetical protein [Candidatus Sulfotelmatobacter sp.]